MAGAGARRDRGDDAISASARAAAPPSCASPTTPPARSSTGSRSSTQPKALLQGRGVRGGRAARQPSLLRLGRDLQPAAAGDLRASCGRARSATLEEKAPAGDRRRQYRLHDADRRRHRRCRWCIPSQLLDWATGGPRPAALGRRGLRPVRAAPARPAPARCPRRRARTAPERRMLEAGRGRRPSTASGGSTSPAAASAPRR